ncbi:hypothetical protein EFN56_07215 [Leuconostoc citreum]|nr:hypothetical protein [Leuconostoc citreum]
MNTNLIIGLIMLRNDDYRFFFICDKWFTIGIYSVFRYNITNRLVGDISSVTPGMNLEEN